MDNLYESQDFIWNKSYKDKLLHKDELTEEDFYPPADNRTSHIYKHNGFESYVKYIYDLYEEEGYYEN